jgi:TonB family protein
MNELIIYMVKSALYLAGFYTIYFLFLSRDTRYERNRTFILLSMGLSFLLPLITISIRESGTISYFGKSLSEIFVTAERPAGATDAASARITTLSVTLFRVYIAGLVLFGLKLLIDFLTLFFLILRKREKENRIIFFRGYDTAGFSAMGYIFINQNVAAEDADEIIRHEKNHLNQNHFYDILFLETVKIFQWFNPVIYMFNRSLRAIHEYQADEGCLSSGMPVISYQNLLLNHLFRSKVFIASNSFSNPSLLKKRMIMMTKARSGSSTSLKLLFVVPVAVFLLMVNSAFESSLDMASNQTLKELTKGQSKPVIENTKAPELKQLVAENIPAPPPPPPPPPAQGSNKKETITAGSTLSGNIKSGDVPVVKREEEAPEEVFVVVEEMPSFPGGDAALMKFINDNIIYPESAKENNIEGRVVLKFCVTYKGAVEQVNILKKVDPSLDAEAVRVIKLLPAFIPGRQGGKPVNVWYNVPVVFQLK